MTTTNDTDVDLRGLSAVVLRRAPVLVLAVLIAVSGTYLYSSSHSKLWMYNADDLVEISGRLVLPAMARWTAHGPGGLSSISLDRSAKPHQLKAINYSRKGQA